MAPKKSAAAKNGSTTDDAGKESTKFSWSAENERKLLLFTHPFSTVSSADFEKLLQHFPGTNMNGIKIRYSRMRVERTKLAEQYGFVGLGAAAAGETSTPKKGGGAKGKKRAATADADDDDADGGEDLGAAAKKVKKGGAKDEDAGGLMEDLEVSRGVKTEELI